VGIWNIIRKKRGAERKKLGAQGMIFRAEWPEPLASSRLTFSAKAWLYVFKPCIRPHAYPLQLDQKLAEEGTDSVLTECIYETEQMNENFFFVVLSFLLAPVQVQRRQKRKLPENKDLSVKTRQSSA
jgi:hypothetical protein